MPISSGSAEIDQHIRRRVETLDLGDLAGEVGVTDLVGQLLDHLATDVVHRVALLEVLRQELGVRHAVIDEHGGSLPALLLRELRLDRRLDVVTEGQHEHEVADLGDDRGRAADINERDPLLLGYLPAGADVVGIGQTDQRDDLVLINHLLADVRDRSHVALRRSR